MPYFMKKQCPLPEQLCITSHIKLMLNKDSKLFFSNTLRNLDQSVIFFIRILIKDVDAATIIFEAHIFVCILGRATYETLNTILQLM